MPDTSSAPKRRLLYGRQQGHKLRKNQQALFDTLLPGLSVGDESGQPIDPVAVFDGAVDGVFLEIGFGGGEHLIARAQQNPARGFIGAEPFVNGVAKILAAIETSETRNIRLHHGDARDIIERLPDQSISGAYLLYPDPWPKKRHNKRRFVNEENIDQLHRILRPGGHFMFASDIPDYVRWTLGRMLRSGGFTWTAESKKDWAEPPEGWPGTRYEAKALREGRRAHYLHFCKS